MEPIDLTSDFSDSENEDMDDFPFKCTKCSEKFRQREEALKHFFQSHQLNQQEDSGLEDSDGSEKVQDSGSTVQLNHPCPKCSRVFKYERPMLNHLRSKHKVDKKEKVSSVVRDGEVNNHCTICDKQYASRGTYKLHMKSFHDGVTYDCPRCGKKCKQNVHRMSHMINNPNCDKEPPKKNGRRKSSKNQGKPQKISLPPKIARKNINVEINIKEELMTTMCPICFMKIRSKNLLKNHLDEQHEPSQVEKYFPKDKNLIPNSESDESMMILENNNVSNEKQSILLNSESKQFQVKPKLNIKIAAFAMANSDEENVVETSTSTTRLVHFFTYLDIW